MGNFSEKISELRLLLNQFSSFTPTNRAEKALFSKKNTKTMSQVLLFRT